MILAFFPISTEGCSAGACRRLARLWLGSLLQAWEVAEWTRAQEIRHSSVSLTAETGDSLRSLGSISWLKNPETKRRELGVPL